MEGCEIFEEGIYVTLKTASIISGSINLLSSMRNRSSMILSPVLRVTPLGMSSLRELQMYMFSLGSFSSPSPSLGQLTKSIVNSKSTGIMLRKDTKHKADLLILVSLTGILHRNRSRKSK